MAAADFFVTEEGINLPSRTTDPVSPAEGTMWHRSDTNDIRFHVNSTVTIIPLVIGDMDIAIFDPTAVNGDAFDMGNMVESATSKILTDVERASISSSIHDNVAGEIDAIANKAVPVSSDRLLIEDSADSFNKKEIEVGDLPNNGLPTKSGEESAGSFAGNPKKKTVSLSTPFADSNYSVSIIGQGTDSRSWTIESKLAGSFVINSNSNSVLTNPVLWLSIKHGES